MVDDAVARFVAEFVVTSKRERARMLLVHDDRQRRIEGLQTLYKWLRREATTELGGGAGFPHRLRERFGEVRGILVREGDALTVGVPHAAFLATGTSGALFLADATRMALLFPEVGPPTLIRKA
jgi:hypothetical protein